MVSPCFPRTVIVLGRMAGEERGGGGKRQEGRGGRGRREAGGWKDGGGERHWGKETGGERGKKGREAGGKRGRGGRRREGEGERQGATESRGQRGRVIRLRGSFSSVYLSRCSPRAQVVAVCAGGASSLSGGAHGFLFALCFFFFLLSFSLGCTLSGVVSFLCVVLDPWGCFFSFFQVESLVTFEEVALIFINAGQQVSSATVSTIEVTSTMGVPS